MNNKEQKVETSTAPAIVGNNVLPAVYHCKSCGFISTRRKEYTYIKGAMFCVGCKEDYETGVENVTRWVTSALNGR
jgi:hypothetical protein